MASVARSSEAGAAVAGHALNDPAHGGRHGRDGGGRGGPSAAATSVVAVEADAVTVARDGEVIQAKPRSNKHYLAASWTTAIWSTGEDFEE